MPRITILLLVITPLPFGALTARADPFLPPPLLSSPEIHQLSTPSPVIEDPRVLYWNMRWFPAGPGDDLTGPRAMKKIESCAQTLQATNADILFLSEVINLESLKKMDLHYPYLVCSDIERHPSSPSRLPAQNWPFSPESDRSGSGSSTLSDYRTLPIGHRAVCSPYNFGSIPARY